MFKIVDIRCVILENYFKVINKLDILLWARIRDITVLDLNNI